MAGPMALLWPDLLSMESAVGMRSGSQDMGDMGRLYNRQDRPVKTQSNIEEEISNPIGPAVEADH
jgi:hypothetical protein